MGEFEIHLIRKLTRWWLFQVAYFRGQKKTAISYLHDQKEDRLRKSQNNRKLVTSCKTTDSKQKKPNKQLINITPTA